MPPPEVVIGPQEQPPEKPLPMAESLSTPESSPDLTEEVPKEISVPLEAVVTPPAPDVSITSPPVEEEGPVPEGMDRCPSCRTLISDTAVMCYRCGKKLKDERPPAPKEEPVDQEDKVGREERREERRRERKEEKKEDKKPEPEPPGRKKKALFREEELAERLKESQEDSKNNPKDPSEWFNQGTILVEMGKYEDAIIAFNRGLQIEPNNMPAWSAKAYAFNKIGRQREASVCYRKAMEIGMARSAIDVDEMLHAVEASKTYKEALDRAIGVIAPKEVAAPVDGKRHHPQPRCPKCKSFKVRKLDGDRHRCAKCETTF